jgi:peptidoglycan/LPS O-acetylase OafA/YrhL
MQSTRYHTLDHWRGIACLLVVVSHSTAPSTWRDTIGFFPPLGKIGVGIFFAISGYCIAAAVDSSRKREYGFGNFMFRRFRRIFPPYWAALLMTFTWKLAVYGPTSVRLSAWDYFGNLTLTETWLRIVNGDPNVNLLLEQAWTLCHEEQFYLICGLLLLAPARFFLPAIIAFCGLTIGVFVANRLGYIDLSGTVLAGTWL